MRFLQYKILTRILEEIPAANYIHGFEKGRSIPKMAQLHVNKDLVISLDISNFFPSIHQNLVESMFRSVGVAQKQANLLSELCTYKYFVPQGALTSPKLSNLITTGTFGPELEEFCLQKDLTLTVYADDITVSRDVGGMTREEVKTFVRGIIDSIKAIVKTWGFDVNTRKTKVMRRFQRQWVCGAVVNEKVNMRKKERLSLRALIYNCEQNGIIQEAAKTNMNPETFIRKYAGRINWLCQLNPDQGMLFKVKFRRVASGYLNENPGIDIPELSWNSSIEMPYVPTKEDVGVFVN